jgi:hypothetical protein
LWSLVVFSPLWSVWTKKNLATLVTSSSTLVLSSFKITLVDAF